MSEDDEALWNVTLPLLMVFGTDRILWPTILGPLCPRPYIKTRNDKITDGKGNTVYYGDEIPDVFEALNDIGIEIGVAYFNEYVKETTELLPLFNWHKYVSFQDIATEDPVTKFRRIRNSTEVDYHRTIFIDHIISNITVLRELGITPVELVSCASVLSVKRVLRIFQQTRREYFKIGEFPRGAVNQTRQNESVD